MAGISNTIRRHLSHKILSQACAQRKRHFQKSDEKFTVQRYKNVQAKNVSCGIIVLSQISKDKNGGEN